MGATAKPYHGGTVIYGTLGYSFPSRRDMPSPEPTIAMRVTLRNHGYTSIILPKQLRGVQERVLAFAGLPRNWDGQGAAPVEAATVERALSTLWDLAKFAVNDKRELPAPAASVSPDGSVGFEWSSPTAYVAVDCPGSNERRSVYVRKNGKEIERSVRSTGELWNAIRDALSS